jgi:phosphinothricin acetyltransferase
MKASVMHVIIVGVAAARTPRRPVLMHIRNATEADIAGLTAIYNEVIATSTAIYAEEPVTPEERRLWWRARLAQGYPVLIAHDTHGVTGFASFGDFRVPSGYRFTVEHTVHVRADVRSRGTGAALVRALLERAAALGKHVMIAGVDAANAGAIRFHERLGFERSAVLREVGHKFGRRLDLLFLQRRVGAG